MSVLDSMTRESFIAVFNMHETNISTMQAALAENLDKIAGHEPAEHSARQARQAANRVCSSELMLSPVCVRLHCFRSHQGARLHVVAQSVTAHGTDRVRTSLRLGTAAHACSSVFVFSPVCTYLVFIMQLGFALLEAGSVRAMVSAPHAAQLRAAATRLGRDITKSALALLEAPNAAFHVRPIACLRLCAACLPLMLSLCALCCRLRCCPLCALLPLLLSLLHRTRRIF